MKTGRDPKGDVAERRDSMAEKAVHLGSGGHLVSTATVLRLGLIVAMLAASLTLATSAQAQQSLSLDVQVSCLRGNGRLDISFVADSAGTYEVLVGALAPRQHVVAAGETVTEVVTGRRDGPIPVDVRRQGVIVAETTATVDCDADQQTRADVTCLGGNGRIDVWIAIPQNADVTEVQVLFARANGPDVGPRVVTVVPGQVRRATTTGRPDDNYTITVTTTGAAPLQLFQEQVVVACDASGDPVTFTLSCLAENGRLDFDLYNDANTSSTFVVTVPPLADRTRTLAPGASTRISYTGRKDQPIAAVVRRDGAAIWQQTVTPDCDPDQEPEPTPTPTPVPADDSLVALPSSALVETDTPGPSITLGLRQAEAVVQQAEQIEVATGTPLDAAATAALLDRLPPLVVDEGDQVDFRPPEVSLPRPSTFDTIDDPFPPPAGPGPVIVPNEPLEVLRFQPEGETALAPFLSVTFSQPMVALGAIGEIEAAASPVTLTPSQTGRWIWIGTRTLRFESTDDLDRLPGSTAYTVTIPAGTTSATGNALADSVSWTFQTSPVALEAMYPSEGQTIELDQVVVARFDQLIDAQAVVDTTSLRVRGVTTAVRLATDAEIADDPQAARYVDSSRPGRFVALRAAADFPTDAPIRVEFANLPSAEGPLLQPERLGSSYRTYGPFEIDNTACGYQVCRPFDTFSVNLTNPIDRSSFDLDDVTISPAIPGAQISASYRSIRVRGATDARTTYTVTLPAELTDRFGQSITGGRTATFKVGDASPSLNVFGGRRFVTVDPFLDTPSVEYTVVNVDQIRVWAVSASPEQWPEWVNRNGQDFPDAIGEVVFDETIQTGAAPNEPTTLTTDLGGALRENGSLIVLFEPVGEGLSDRSAWVQATQLGVDATVDDDELSVWVTDLRTGDPIAGAQVEPVGPAPSAITNEDGLARIQLSGEVLAVNVTSAADEALLPAGYFGNGWRATERQDSLRWHTFDDRSLYRPGETIHVKGWVRRFAASTDALLRPAGVQQVDWVAFDPRNNEISSGSSPVSALGGFDLSFTTPTTANLGQARVTFSARTELDGGGQQWRHTYSLQEFRRPEFEVETDVVTPAPHFAGDEAIVEARANYFAGGGLPDAEVDWSLTSRQTRYSPPGWDRYTFGARSFGGSATETYEGTTDANGTHRLLIDLAPNLDAAPSPVSVTASAEVTDVNRQQFENGTTLLVHPADRYVGLRTDRAYVRAGDSLDVNAIVTDLDGIADSGVAISVEVARVVGQWTEGGWTSQEVDSATCTRTSGAQPVSCSFDVATGGRWVVRARIQDDAGRSNLTQMTRWVGGARIGGTDRVERQSVELIADQGEYEPGDTATILVIAPFESGHGLLTTARNGIVSQEVFDVTGGSAELSVPIDEAMLPNVWLQVEVVGATARSQGPDVPRPAYAGGTLRLDVPPTARELDVAITPAATQIEPGASTSATVRVTGANGSPVAGSEVAVVAVDEAVLALTDYTIPDPTASFWQQVASRVSTQHGRSSVLLSGLGFGGPEQPDKLLFEDGVPDAVAAPGAAERSLAEGDVSVRSDFNPLAVFAPEVRTDANGMATVSFDLPDNLTRYRLIAVAVEGADRFGSGESSFTARLPLMARPSAPRFANFGDVFELPVVVQNQTDADLNVDVALRASNLSITGPAGRRVLVPANDRVEVRFPTTTDEAGTARFQVIAVNGPSTDAAEISFPVLTPATSESFATYGVLDQGAVSQPVEAPADVFAQFGGLEVGTSTTALHSLSDAVLYLSSHRYTSASALSSRILGIAALDDVLPAFGAEGLPSPEALRVIVAQDIEALVALQNGDGGFSTWSRDTRSWPWASLHATHAMAVAQANGYAVPQAALDSALGYAASIESQFEEFYSQRTRDSLSAYALHVRDIAGDRDVEKATELYRADLAADALGWIWPIVEPATAAEIARQLNNLVVETPSSASFATDAQDGDWVILRSDRRTDAIVLDAMMRVDPTNDLIPKVVAGLQASRRNGRWSTLSENTFVLLAFDRYFATFESVEPNLVARTWLGDLYAAEHDHPGRSTDRIQTVVPMSEVLAAGDTDIVVQDDGVGRLYWRLGLRYAPTDLDLDPLDRGFVVQRTYTSLGDPGDVTQDADGTWRIKAGADVGVTVTMVANSVRSHVALIDPLPAGLEPLNPTVQLPVLLPIPEFGVPGAIGIAEPGLIGRPCFFCGGWFDHQNLRDDRAEAFSTYLSGGTYDYSYVARATTIGTFVTPPTRAEMIHQPEVFGRSATDIVIVEDEQR